MLRRPKRSPSEPPTSSSAARNSAYASTTHCASNALACRSRWIAGNATLTTVPSTKAMLEPMIEATSTQRLAAAVQGAARAPWRVAPASQGPLMALLDMVRAL